MKASLPLVFTSLMSLHCYSQTRDTLLTTAPPDIAQSSFQYAPMTSLKSARAAAWGAILTKENVVIKTNHLPLSTLENEITDLESRECGAVKKRDTLALMRLWARDFTLRETENKIINSKNGLPNYIWLIRMIETTTPVDSNTVYTSGFESFREIKTDRKTSSEETRKYFHVWTRKNGLWKLTTKRTN